MPPYRFSISIEVRYGDLDPQGHVNNARHLTYLEQARLQYFIHLGLFGTDQPFLDLGVIIAEARVTYLAPIYYGQDVQVGTRTSRIGNKSLTLEHTIYDGASGEALATGTTVLVAYDYRAEKSIPVPAEWRSKIEAFEAGN